jgi:N-acetylglucosamine malate deacetylase 1
MLDDHSPLPELDLLVVAPHPDDAEISAGGLILKARSEGLRVGVLDLTNGEPTPRGSVELRARESAAAGAILQLDWRGNAGLPNRSLEETLDARRAVASVFRRTRPTVIAAPYWEDAHPDHVAATAIIEAARFWAKLSRSDIPGEPWHPAQVLYYFSIHLRIHPQPAFVLDISDQFETKQASIGCYASQFPAGQDGTPHASLGDIRDRARYWGWSIGRKYGEPYATREPLGVTEVRGLDLWKGRPIPTTGAAGSVQGMP